MLTALLLAGLVHVAAPLDTISMDVIKAEYDSVFDVIAVPPGSNSPQGIAILVRRDPPSTYLGGYERAYPWVLTYLLQQGRSFDLAAIQNGPGSWAERISRARRAVHEDPQLAELIREVLGPWLATKGVALRGYRGVSVRRTISMQDLVRITSRMFYPDEIEPDGTLGAHICTDVNAVRDLPGPRHVLAEAFAFATIHHHMKELVPAFGSAMDLAQRADVSADSAMAVARAQGTVWGQLISSGILEKVLAAEYAARERYAPVHIVANALRGHEAAHAGG